MTGDLHILILHQANEYMKRSYDFRIAAATSIYYLKLPKILAVLMKVNTSTVEKEDIVKEALEKKHVDTGIVELYDSGAVVATYVNYFRSSNYSQSWD